MLALWEACMWGLAGATVVEASELYGAIRRIKEFPWNKKGEVPLVPYIVSVALRLGIGVLGAAMIAMTGPLSPAGAVAAGIAGPKLFEELGRHRQGGIPASPSDAAHTELAHSSVLLPREGPAQATAGEQSTDLAGGPA